MTAIFTYFIIDIVGTIVFVLVMYKFLDIILDYIKDVFKGFSR